MCRNKVVLLLASLIFVLLSGELALRVYYVYYKHWTVADVRFTPKYRDYYFFGPALKSDYAPNIKKAYNAGLFKYGFHGTGKVRKENGNVIRILCFGGSTSLAGNYPEHLQELFDEGMRNSGYTVEVVNAACPAWTTTHSLIQFVTRGLYLDPDIIIVYHAINDSYLSDDEWLFRLREVQYEKNGGFLQLHSYLYNFLKARIYKTQASVEAWLWLREVKKGKIDRNDTMLDRPSPNIFEKDMESFVAISRFNGIKPVFVTMPLNYDPKDSYEENAERAAKYVYKKFENQTKVVDKINQTTRKIARKYGIPLIDIAGSDSIDLKKDDFSDLCHFTTSGANKFSAKLYQKIRPMVIELIALRKSNSSK